MERKADSVWNTIKGTEVKSLVFIDKKIEDFLEVKAVDAGDLKLFSKEEEFFEEDTLMLKSLAQFYQFLFKNNLLRKK